MIDLSGGISNPLIQACIVAGAGVIALVFRRWRTGMLAIAVALAWAYLCATPGFAFLLWRGLANQYPPHPPASYPRADAIVLIGGSQTPDPLSTWIARDDPALSTPFGMAVGLYRARRATVIVATSNYAAPAAATALVRQRIAPDSLHLERASETTRQDAADSARALRRLHATSILLVTTRSHMRRTAATFRALGFGVVVAPSYAPDWIRRSQHTFHPGNAGLYLSRLCLHEYIGLAYYAARGWTTF